MRSVMRGVMRGVVLVKASGAAPFVGPLDALPAVSAAYSMRRLLSSYVANKAINVRRASDSTAIDVGFLANGDLDVATLTAFLAATTGFITTWYDQSSNGSNLVQGTAARQPGVTLSAAAANNRSVANFLRASTQFVAVSISTINQPFTVAAVAERTGDTGSFNTVASDGGGIDGIFFSNAADLFAGSVSGTVRTTAANDNVAHALALVFNAGSSRFAVDQTLSTPAAFGANGFTTGIRVGNDTGGNALTGVIGEVVIWPSALSDPNLTALQANQKTYWGTP